MNKIRSRRNFLKLTSLTSGGIISSAPNLNAGWSDFWNHSSKAVRGIPISWFELFGVEVYQYANYILKLKLRNITPRMVIAPHLKTRGGHRNCLPPKKMWHKIKPTLIALDSICDSVGLPVKEILSAYRSPEYNRAVRGNIGSYHMTNQALDVRFCKTSAWKVSRVAHKLRDENLFKGGIGRYKNFVHIDTRGVNADW